MDGVMSNGDWVVVNCGWCEKPLGFCESVAGIECYEAKCFECTAKHMNAAAESDLKTRSEEASIESQHSKAGDRLS
jgi:hypothetical protein